MPQPVILPPCHNDRVPAATHPWRHCIDIQTRFNDYDLFRHANNTSYLQYFDIAKISYFEAVLGQKVDHEDIGAVIVNINVNFYSPAAFGESLCVVTACTGISRHSFTLEQRVVNPSTGDVKCCATVVMATFDPRTMTSPELSQRWADALQAFESARLTH